MGKISVILGDDHDLIRQGLIRIIGFEEDIQIVGEGGNGQEVIDQLEEAKPDVVVLDVNMPVLDGLGALAYIKQNYKEIKVIMLTIEDDKKTIQKAMHLGCDGYILKESSGQVISQAIRVVKGGGSYLDQMLVNTLFQTPVTTKSIFEQLAPRELDVLHGMCKGLSNKQIGESLYISEKTVKNYASTLFRKLEVEDRVQAILVAMRNNIEDYVQMLEGKK